MENKELYQRANTYRQTYFKHDPLTTNRSLLAYIFLGLITLGIYDYYVLYTISRDLNIACSGDGKETPGMVEFIMFGLLTCGIYQLYWYYSVGNRLAANAPRYGLQFPENGTTVLLWVLFGAFLCGIGSFIGIDILLKNTNAICDAYNRQ
jgi:hypothetical protein